VIFKGNILVHIQCSTEPGGWATSVEKFTDDDDDSSAVLRDTYNLTPKYTLATFLTSFNNNDLQPFCSKQKHIPIIRVVFDSHP